MWKKKMTLTLLATALISGATLMGQPTISAEDGIIEKSVNFREEPSLSGDRVRYLKAGEHVDILEQVNHYWYKIKDQRGQIGYVTTQSQFIKTTNDSSSDNPKQSISGTSKNIIDAGMKYLGTPYVFGSNRSNTQTFDCSDFVRQAFKDGANIILPGNSRTQADYVKKIGEISTNWRDLKPGDIMFFMSYKGSKSINYSGINKSLQRITHNGIYLGNGKILHTYSEKSGGVRIDNIEGNNWEYRFVFGGSALK